MLNKIITIIFILTFTVCALPQTTGINNPTDKNSEKRAELEKESVAFLRETFSDVANLRTPENRISFNAEMANLMWFHDEKEARSMFETVITDFRQMLVQINAQLASVKLDAGEAELYSIPMMPASNPQAKLIKKFSKAMSVRQQIAAAVSEHDPVLAYSFYNDTAQSITNPDLRKQFENRDNGFEMKLLQAIAEKDADKGLDAARKSLAKGLTMHHIEILKKLYAKDAGKGATFGEDIIGKLKSQGLEKGESFYYLKLILSTGIENRSKIKDKPNQKPMFGEQSLRDLAEAAAQAMLKRPNLEEYGIGDTVELIKPFLPGRAVQIEQKIALEKRNQAASKTSDGEFGEADESGSSPYAAASMSRYKKMEEQAKTMENLKNLGMKKLPDAERKKVIAEAKKMVAEIDDPNARTLALSTLAAQIAKMGDTETATEIIREAERFISPQPKNYMDYTQSWMLASGYSEINPEKAFPILENTVSQLNDTVSAFIKVGEFIDVNGDFIEDGEVQVGSFGGEITNGLLRSLGQTDSTLMNLAAADFTRTKALTNRFDRTEVRILAKMLVLRAILGRKKASDNEEMFIESASLQ